MKTIKCVRVVCMCLCVTKLMHTDSTNILVEECSYQNYKKLAGKLISVTYQIELLPLLQTPTIFKKNKI